MDATNEHGRLGAAAERPQLGIIVKMPAAATIELAGCFGFDFAVIDAEHGPGDMSEIEHHVRAADSTGIRALVRVPNARSPDILRALDAGACGVVVPHVTSPEDARDAVTHVRYPPEGRRSLALSTRAGRHGTRPVEEHLEAAQRELTLIAQIEDAEALERVPEILGVEGLDGIFVGPADLSASMGRPGELDDPLVSGAIERVVAETLARPRIALCALAGDEGEGRAWIGRGARLVLFNAPALMAGRFAAIAAALQPVHDLGPRSE